MQDFQADLLRKLFLVLIVGIYGLSPINLGDHRNLAIKFYLIPRGGRPRLFIPGRERFSHHISKVYRATLIEWS